VTAVVLNWCDAQATRQCLASVKASSYPNLSIVLVDNGSPDGSGDVLEKAFPEVDYLQTGENLGYSGGNNRGIVRALEGGAEYVLILNHDTVIEPDAVDFLVETAVRDPGVGAVAPTIVRLDDPDHVWYGGGTFDPKRALGVHWNGRGGPSDVGQEPREVSFFTGCAVLFRAEAIREEGMFTESYFLYVEDAELSLRLNRAGWQILHDPRARVRHRVPPEGTEPTPDQIRYRDRNRRRLAREHLGPVRRIAFGAWFYPTRAVHLARYLARGDLSRAQAIVRGLSER
jgi:GT2 family glycosyltransferase